MDRSGQSARERGVDAPQLTPDVSDVLGPADRRAFLDVIRSFGILQVVLFHVLFGVFSYGTPQAAQNLIGAMPAWMNFAWHTYGVDAIFLVSTLLLSLSLLGEIEATGRVDLRRYAVKRISRILPLYYLALIAFQLASPFDLAQFILSALFLGVTLGVGNVIPVGWSMEVMMLFYLCLPFVLNALLTSGRPLLLTVLAVLGITVWRVLYLGWSDLSATRVMLDVYEGLGAAPASQELYYRPWFRLPPFLIGMGMAIALHQRARQPAHGSRSPLRRLTVPLLGALLVVATFWTPAQDAAAGLYRLPEVVLALYFGAGITLFSLGLALLMWPALTGKIGWVQPLARPAAFVSARIFGIYLFHMPFLLIGAVVVLGGTDIALMASINTAQVWMIFALTALMSCGFAHLLLRFIERPLMSRLRRSFLGETGSGETG